MEYVRGETNHVPFVFNQMEFHMVQIEKKTVCHHNHISFNMKENGNLFSWAYTREPRSRLFIWTKRYSVWFIREIELSVRSYSFPIERNHFSVSLTIFLSRLYLPYSDWFGTKRTSVRFKINRTMVNTIWFRVDLIRFRKDFSVCTFFTFGTATERWRLSGSWAPN